MSGTEDERFGEAHLYAASQDVETGEILHGSTSCHVCSVNPLGPGKTITFSVPFEYARRRSVMRIAYDFNWERDAGAQSSDVLHTVNFYFSGLPESILPK